MSVFVKLAMAITWVAEKLSFLGIRSKPKPKKKEENPNIYTIH